MTKAKPTTVTVAAARSPATGAKAIPGAAERMVGTQTMMVGHTAHPLEHPQPRRGEEAGHAQRTTRVDDERRYPLHRLLNPYPPNCLVENSTNFVLRRRSEEHTSELQS